MGLCMTKLSVVRYPPTELEGNLVLTQLLPFRFFRRQVFPLIQHHYLRSLFSVVVVVKLFIIPVIGSARSCWNGWPVGAGRGCAVRRVRDDSGDQRLLALPTCTATRGSIEE